MNGRIRSLLLLGLLATISIGACTSKSTPPPADTVNTLAVKLVSIMLTQTATASSPTHPPSMHFTATFTPTDTPTVELQFTAPQPPTVTSPPFVPSPSLIPTRRPLRTKTPPTELPSATPSITPTPTYSCEKETAFAILSIPSGTLKIGDEIKAKVTVNNEGCVNLGLPQYRLYIRSEESQSIFSPEQPDPVVHYLSIVPGQSDSAEFVLTAISNGQATITGSVSYEVHLGYPGPAYWGYRETAPVVIGVEP